MALFSRKEKEQPLHPHIGTETAPGIQPALPTEVVPVVPIQEHQKSTEQQHGTEIIQPETVPLPGGGGIQRAPAAIQTSVPPAVKTETRQEIETVLSDGLTKVYQSMTPAEQQKFRVAGEEAVSKIEQLVTKFQATARLVLDIIRAWLASIPRVNHFFLEQDSKIKTDRIMIMQRKMRRQQHQKHIHME